MAATHTHTNLHMFRNASFLAIALICGSALSAVGAPDGAETAQVVIAHAWLTSHLTMLAGGCLLHGRWRLTREPAMAWLATGFLVPSLPLTYLAIVRLAEPAPAWTDGLRAPLDLTTSVAVLALIVLTVRKRRFPAPLNPIALAAPLSVAATGVAMVAADVVPPPNGLIHAFTVGVIAIGGVATYRLRWLRASHRAFLVVAVSGVAIAHDFHNVADRSSAVPLAYGYLFAALSVISAVVLVVLTLGLFRRSLDLKARRQAAYQARAEVAEARLRRDQELMHELRATMAGISTAAQVLHGSRYTASPVTEKQLGHMLDAEVRRVQRLLAGKNGIPSCIDLDTLLADQVTAQRALGHDVRWQPSGLMASGRPDKVAEAVHVLLTNAARYAAGAPVHIVTAIAEDVVRIAITDSGPGVSPDILPVLFERGTHEPSSPGLGVGLYLAKKAVQADGGSISLRDPRPGSGATFVIGLPIARNEEET
jgi:signal transduction histidine kinase